MTYLVVMQFEVHRLLEVRVAANGNREEGVCGHWSVVVRGLVTAHGATIMWETLCFPGLVKCKLRVSH